MSNVITLILLCNLKDFFVKKDVTVELQLCKIKIMLDKVVNYRHAISFALEKGRDKSKVSLVNI